MFHPFKKPEIGPKPDTKKPGPPEARYTKARARPKPKKPRPATSLIRWLFGISALFMIINMSENMSPHFFITYYSSMCGWSVRQFGRPKRLAKFCPRCNGFLAHMRPGKKRPSKEVWSMPFPLEAQIRHSSILLCKSLSLHVLAGTHTEYVVRSYCSMYSLLLSGWLVAWRYWWMSLSRLRTDQSSGVEEPSGFCFKY